MFSQWFIIIMSLNWLYLIMSIKIHIHLQIKNYYLQCLGIDKLSIINITFHELRILVKITCLGVDKMPGSKN